MTFKVSLKQIPGLDTVGIPLTFGLPEEDFPHLLHAQHLHGFQEIRPIPTGKNALDHAVHG